MNEQHCPCMQCEGAAVCVCACVCVCVCVCVRRMNEHQYLSKVARCKRCAQTHYFLVHTCIYLHPSTHTRSRIPPFFSLDALRNAGLGIDEPVDARPAAKRGGGGGGMRKGKGGQWALQERASRHSI